MAENSKAGCLRVGSRGDEHWPWWRLSCILDLIISSFWISCTVCGDQTVEANSIIGLRYACVGQVSLKKLKCGSCFVADSYLQYGLPRRECSNRCYFVYGVATSESYYVVLTFSMFPGYTVGNILSLPTSACKTL